MPSLGSQVEGKGWTQAAPEQLDFSFFIQHRTPARGKLLPMLRVSSLTSVNLPQIILIGMPRGLSPASCQNDNSNHLNDYLC